MFNLEFEVNERYIEKLKLKDASNFRRDQHPDKMATWGAVSAIGTEGYLEFKCITYKDRKPLKIRLALELAKLTGLPDSPAELASNLKLQPPA